MGKPRIGYWKIRGLIEPIRLLLEYAGIEYEQDLYQCGPAPNFDRSCWLDKKFTLGLDFPNLPYYMDDNIKLTESWAILKHIAGKTGVVPDDEASNAICHMLEGVITSFRSGFTAMCYNKNFEEIKQSYIGNAAMKLKQFEEFLSGKAYLTGERVMYVDFAFFEICDHHRMLFPEIFNKYSNIKAYMDRFESLDKVSAYRKSERFNRSPVNNTMAGWTG